MNSPRSTRRTFLTTTLGASALAASPLSAWATPSGPRGRAYRLRVGLASYSTRKLTLDQTLQLCKDVDIAYINLKDFHLPMTDSPEAIAATRAKIEAAGVGSWAAARSR